MNTKSKIRTLQAACVLIMGILSYIQFSLIKNTYLLTRDNYDLEVKTAIEKIINPPSATLENKMLNNLVSTNYSGTEGQAGKRTFLKIITAKTDSVIKKMNQSVNQRLSTVPVLKGVSYYSNYDKINIKTNEKKPVFLTAYEKPGVNISARLSKGDLLLIRRYSLIFSIKKTDTDHKDNTADELRLYIKGAHYADISGWKKEVFRRMAGTFLLAVLLLIAVAALFYFIFSTLLKQKRIAEIKTDFANNITHELKTPLSSVSLIVKSLERKEVQANQAMFNELLQTLNRQQTKIRQIIDSVMESVVLPDSDQELAESDITAWLTRYTKDIRFIYPSFTADITPGVQILKTHLPTLEKVLNNLVENAAKYSPLDSAIELKAYQTGTFYLIEISDHGPGIAKQYQSQVFDKFYRIPEHNRHTVKGLGLGLYISRQAVCQIGGSLTLISKAGKGCNFTIKLPV